MHSLVLSAIVNPVRIDRDIGGEAGDVIFLLESEPLGPEDDVVFLVGLLGHTANTIGSLDAIDALEAVIVLDRHSLVKVVLDGIVMLEDMGGVGFLLAILGGQSDFIDVRKTEFRLENNLVTGKEVLDVKLGTGFGPPLEKASESPVQFRDVDGGNGQVLKDSLVNLAIKLNLESAVGQSVVAF